MRITRTSHHCAVCRGHSDGPPHLPRSRLPAVSLPACSGSSCSMYPMYSRRAAPRLPFRASSRCASLTDRNSNLGNPALLQISTARCSVSYHRGGQTHDGAFRGTPTSAAPRQLAELVPPSALRLPADALELKSRGWDSLNSGPVLRSSDTHQRAWGRACRHGRHRPARGWLPHSAHRRNLSLSSRHPDTR